MYLFFLALSVLHVVGLLLTLGTIVWTTPEHILFGLLTALEGLLLDTLLLFYFIGTGSWVRKNTPTTDPRRGEFLDRVRGYRRGFFSLLGLSMLLWIATTSSGGASMAGYIPTWVHGLGAGLVGLFHLVVLGRGLRRVRDSLVFLESVEAYLFGSGPTDPAEGTGR